MRRFTCTAGGSNKFWEYKVSGRDVTVRWGKIGSEGQTQLKTYGDSFDALDAVRKLVDQKLAKGYKEILINKGSITNAQLKAVKKAAKQIAKEAKASKAPKVEATPLSPEQVEAARYGIVAPEVLVIDWDEEK